jgi:hypothetical protein
MAKRDSVSEGLLVVMSAFTFMLLFVCPGWFFLFLLPPWVGIPLAVAAGCVGPWAMNRVDLAAYGPREEQ